MAMIPNTPWLKTVPQFDDEAIASVAVRLAPMGRIDTDTLLRLHLDMPGQSISAIATRPDAIAELVALGSFDLDRLCLGAWKIFKDRTRFLGREMGLVYTGATSGRTGQTACRWRWCAHRK